MNLEGYNTICAALADSNISAEVTPIPASDESDVRLVSIMAVPAMHQRRVNAVLARAGLIHRWDRNVDIAFPTRSQYEDTAVPGKPQLSVELAVLDQTIFLDHNVPR